MHAYELHIPLNITGYLLGSWLIASHLWMLAKPDQAIDFLKKFPRNRPAGIALMSLGLAWFWLLIFPKSPLEMNLGEFDRLKGILTIVVPITGFFMISRVKEFLAVRGLGVLGLMLAAPLLYGAVSEHAFGKLLIPIFAYALLTASLFWVGMPYLLRDAINWAVASKGRFKLLTLGGLFYGLATLICAIFYW